MLFSKTLHKGIFVKEIFSGNFTKTNPQLNDIIMNIDSSEKSDTQVLIVSERSLELYDYFYDSNLKIPFLEPRLNQELFFTILVAKVLFTSNINCAACNYLVLLTNCGLVVLAYSQVKKLFEPVCSEILNISCDERDKLMYLRTEEISGLHIITAYSNTTELYIYGLDLISNPSKPKLMLINPENHSTTPYILDVIIRSHEDSPIIRVCALSKGSKSFYVNVFPVLIKKDENIARFIELDESVVRLIDFDEKYLNYAKDFDKKDNLIELIRSLQCESYPDLDYYKFIFSPSSNFIICIGEKGICIFDLNNFKEISYTKVFKKQDSKTSNVLVSHLTYSNKIQLNFENKIYLYEEDMLNNKINKIKIKGKDKKLFNKKLLRIISDEFHFLYYDHKMNFNFTIYYFKTQISIEGKNSSELEIQIVNEYKENSFYCLDSALTKINDEDRLFSICGFQGDSKLIKFEKALQETKIQKFKFTPIEKIFFIDNKNTNEKILFLSGIEGTKILTLDINQNLKSSEDPSLNEYSITQEKTIHLSHFYLEENLFAAQICENSIRVLHFDRENYTSVVNHFVFNFTHSKIILSNSFIAKGKIYFNLYLNNNFFAIYHFDLLDETQKFIQNCLFKFSSNVSCFDYLLSNDGDNILFIVSTYNSRIELYNYSISTKNFSFWSYLDLVNDSKTDIVAENIKIFDKFVFISTRMGEFCMFLLNENSENGIASIHFITTVNLSEEKIVLSISDVSYKMADNLICVNLYNSQCAFLLQLKFPNNEIKNLKINKMKYLIRNESDAGINCVSANNINMFAVMTLASGLELILYQNYDVIYISHFTKSLTDSLIPNTIKCFGSSQIARRMIQYDNRSIIILVESLNEENNLNNLIYIYDTLTSCENSFSLDQNVKINSLKTFEINSKDSSDLEVLKTNYLGLCGHQTENEAYKGLILIYECIVKEDRLSTIKQSNKFLFGENTSINDFCQMKENLVFVSENRINTIRIEVDSNSKKASFIGGIRQSYANRLISINSLPNSYSVIIGDIYESFTVMEYEPQKKRFEPIAADLAMRSLYKAIFDEDSTNSAILLQKTGCFSKFKIADELSEVVYCYDAKEFINRCHLLKPFYVCSTILGSIIGFLEIKKDDLMNNYGVTIEDLTTFGNILIKIYSKKLFNKELPFEMLCNLNEPIKNVFMMDMYETFFKYSDYSYFDQIEMDELKQFNNYEKIIEFISMISFENNLL